MGIYSMYDDHIIDESLKNPNELTEAFILDELAHLSDEKKEEFINSEEAKAMIEAGLISKKTLVRLSKTDDLNRRSTMAAFQMAKENDDPLWNMLVKNRIKERELKQKIVQKYSSKAARIAKTGQKEFLKNKMPAFFMRSTEVREK